MLMQWGLHSAARVKIFEREYLAFFLVIALCIFCLLSTRVFTGNNIYLAVAFTALASAIVLITAKKQLSISEVFPETTRLPLVGQFLA